MDYQMISVDDDVDLLYLPKDLWTSRLPAHLRDRGPHVEETDTGYFTPEQRRKILRDNPIALYGLEDRSARTAAAQAVGASA